MPQSADNHRKLPRNDKRLRPDYQETQLVFDLDRPEILDLFDTEEPEPEPQKEPPWDA